MRKGLIRLTRKPTFLGRWMCPRLKTQVGSRRRGANSADATSSQGNGAPGPVQSAEGGASVMSTNPPLVPKGRPTAGNVKKTPVGGVFIVTAAFAACWYGLLRHQARKEELDPVTGGALPTGEYRMAQARGPAENPDRPATLRQYNSCSSRSPQQISSPEAIRSSDGRAFRAVPDSPQSKSGKFVDSHIGPRPGPQLTPQRTKAEDS
ncbi:hypothetical protein PAXRUDRAFT_23847 [Paxillus rubicundulus Ve08.2h10]|uniref:Transmembrane protein n=1 Tax=Paxillus rubicundulus Ve08.2h10 TaxID=930991 RepID=A0A0D0DKW8_9AGAM|nr:hypothetical protein PAXRUDRAFT_23847 [Paxillus rubicundulus Ve08.2h10]